MPERTQAPEFKKVDSIQFHKAEKQILDNGIPLYIINSGKQPVVRLEIITKSSNWTEAQVGLSHFVGKMLAEGTAKKSSKEISYLFDRYGAFIEINPGLDYTIVTLYCLSKHLVNLLPLLNEIVFEPSFPENELETLKNIKIQNNKVNYEKTSFLASTNFRKNIFGLAHPYGREMKEDDIRSISREALKKHYNETFLNDWQLLIAGEIKDDHIALINNSLGQHKNESIHLKADVHAIRTSGRTFVEKDQSLQSTIRLGKDLFTKDHPDFHKMQIVNEILGGYFGSRLMKNIREDKGFTYGIHSNIVAFKNAGYLVIGTDVKNENILQTIDEVYKEIKVLQNDVIDPEELETVKNYMTGSFLSEINTPFALADKFKSVHLNHLDYDFYQDYLSTINTFGQEDVLEMAQKYLGSDDMIEVIAGGKDSQDT